MDASRVCPECGTNLAADAPSGLCPQCLIGAARANATAPGAGRQQVDDPTFRRAVLELGLVDAAELEWLASGSAGDLSRLVRTLIHAGKLTTYQAAALAQGKARGLVIGDYLVLDKLGRGGMGVVFKAKDRRSDRVVALKILPPSFARAGDAVKRFRREFEVATRLHHPNVVAAIDSAADRGVQFLTMEYVEGHDLDALVEDVGPLPLKLALDCTVQAARGLAAAHAAGIVHRDIKPGNLILDRSGQVKVLDLGLARVVEASNPFGETATQLTQSGAYMGTVDFIAPEQADDSKRADHRADIYSLGCTLYFFLTGRPPFEDETVLKRLIAHQERPAPSLHARRPDVPAALESVYQAMMAKRPGDRPRSMDEVIAALEACRSSPQDGKEARESLKTFGQRALKRAAPRKDTRATNASVFAQRTEPGGLSFDPDLRLEDLVTDYREEEHLDPLAESQMPPKPSRTATRRSRRTRRRPSPVVLGLAALAVLGGVAYFLWPPSDAARPQGSEAADATPAGAPRPSPTAAEITAATEQEGKPAGEDRRPTSRSQDADADAALDTFKNSIGLILKQVPAGTFLMGTPNSEPGEEGERPQHKVTISRPFYLDAYEVLQAEYKSVMGINPSESRESDRLPVVMVSWYDAVAFCNNLSAMEGLKPRYQVQGNQVTILAGDGYCLPTEAEWEYAGRGGKTSRFASSEDLVGVGGFAWSNRNSGGKPHPVGQLRPNAWGFYDMAGNVVEWCQDCHADDYYKHSPAVDPPGADSADIRVARGNSIGCDPDLCRPGARGWYWPDRKRADNGFRVACGSAASAWARVPRPQGKLAGEAQKPARPADPFHRGLELYEKNKFEPAIAEFRAAIRLKPRDADAHYYLGRCYHGLKQYDKAVSAHREAIRLRPPYPEAHVRLKRIAAARNRHDEAQAEAEKAATAFREAIRLRPSDVALHTEFGMFLLQDIGDKDGAIVELREALRLKPEDFRARVELCHLFYDNKQRDAGLAEWRALVKFHPESALARRDLAFVLMEMGHAKEAEPEIRAAVQLDPHDAINRFYYGQILDALDRRKDAIVQHREAHRIDTEHDHVGMAFFAMVEDLRRNGRPAEATDALREVVQRYPDTAQARRELGNDLAKLAQWDEALKHLARAVELDPKDQFLALQVGTLYLQAGDDAAYRRHALAVLDRFAGNPGAQGVVIKCCLMNPRTVEIERASQIAHASFDRAKAANPESGNLGWAQLDLALAEYRSGRFPAAVDLLVRLRSSTGILRVQADMLRALAYGQSGRKADASAVLSNATKALRAGIRAFDGGNSWHDWLLSDLLRREAEVALRDAARKPASLPAPGGAASSPPASVTSAKNSGSSA